jgi:hypothetical protein
VTARVHPEETGWQSSRQVPTFTIRRVLAPKRFRLIVVDGAPCQPTGPDDAWRSRRSVTARLSFRAPGGCQASSRTLSAGHYETLPVQIKSGIAIRKELQCDLSKGSAAPGLRSVRRRHGDRAMDDRESLIGRLFTKMSGRLALPCIPNTRGLSPRLVDTPVQDTRLSWLRGEIFPGQADDITSWRVGWSG